MLNNLHSLTQDTVPLQSQASLRMIKNPRMGGSVPMWETASTAKEQTALRFADVLKAQKNPDTSLRLALIEEPAEGPPERPTSEKPFGFGDLIDIINPLQHIPLIGTLYRNITGDEIRGSGRILGGALFGGPMGAASSMVNVLVEHDTGRDMTELAFDVVRGRTLSAKSEQDQTEETPDMTAAILAYEKPGHLNKNNLSAINITRL
jgi:hypothetical protein